MTTTLETTDVSLLDEVAGHLRHLIQIDTSNPPGNEMAVARYLDQTLIAAGIETHLFEPVANRAAIVARLQGSGEADPVLVLAHMDVVGVERDEWAHDPFGGVIAGGYLYGRGAIDDKGMLAANLVAMLRLKREVVDAGATLRRDVVFIATSDEEMAGDIGLEWLIENHPELVRAEFALNEGGRIRVVDGAPLYAAVQTTEKVSHVVEIVARGPGGHASVPLPGNAVAHLARAVARIAEHQEPIRLLPTTREFFAGLAPIWPDATVARAMTAIASTDAAEAKRACGALCAIPMFNAVLRTGISPTVISAGSRHNVIPTEAIATLSVRTLPGDSIEGVIARLHDLIDDPAVDVVVSSTAPDAPVSDHESPMFAAIRDAIQSLDSNIVAVPYLSTGATESSHLRRCGVQTFGLLPFPLDAEDEGRMHGHDERVPLRSLLFGTEVVYRTLRAIAV
jgi:acetylornithine deacetylase/succinyl-diaminopimelate desuccinylase-like protein